MTLSSLDERTGRELRGLARVLVRSGYASRESVTATLVDAVREDAPSVDAVELTASLIDEAVADLRLDASSWPAETDNDRLDRVLASLEDRGLVVLRYCTDHHDARRALDVAQGNSQGVAFFTDTDAWHAVDFGMLELKLWHADTANVAPGEQLLDDVLSLLQGNGFEAAFDEGRIEISLVWQRRGDWVL